MDNVVGSCDVNEQPDGGGHGEHSEEEDDEQPDRKGLAVHSEEDRGGHTVQWVDVEVVQTGQMGHAVHSEELAAHSEGDQVEHAVQGEGEKDDQPKLVGHAVYPAGGRREWVETFSGRLLEAGSIPSSHLDYLGGGLSLFFPAW